MNKCSSCSNFMRVLKSTPAARRPHRRPATENAGEARVPTPSRRPRPGAAPPGHGPLSGFAAEVGELVARFPQTRLSSSPSCTCAGSTGAGDGPRPSCRRRREPLDGRRAPRSPSSPATWASGWFPAASASAGPGGELFNTALAFSPEGKARRVVPQDLPLAAVRAVRPRGTASWSSTSPGTGRVGFSICYDAWFPEVARHLAWMGAEVIVNPVMTTTADRAQELVLARANAIVNQVFVVSVNTAGPAGTGRSLVVDPEGRVRAEAPAEGADRPDRRPRPGRRHPRARPTAPPG